MNNPYEKFTKEEMILRDHLAVDRTALANERTLLAYVRTSLALVIAGASLIHFFEGVVYTSSAWVLIIFGVLAFFYGLSRYRHVQSLVAKTGYKK